VKERSKNLTAMVVEKTGIGRYGINIGNCMAGLFEPKALIFMICMVP
jgi:hypothetical protein